MDDNRFDHPLTDAALDRELAALLDVAPSPEFRARVRMHVERSPMRASRWGLVVPITAGASTVALALYVGAGLSRPDVTHVQTDSSRREDIRLVGEPVERMSPRVMAIPPVPASGDSMPRVVVSPADAEGLRALMRAAAAGTVTAESFPTVPPAELMALDAIAIEPLEPIAPLSGVMQ
ncbi:MAG: hypothetical protein AB7P99_15655 [Vicinamibacterales bacterium]